MMVFRTVNSMFQHTAARRRLVGARVGLQCFQTFQHTAARRRLAAGSPNIPNAAKFQHTAARRRLGNALFWDLSQTSVSTHSRPKAAGIDSKSDVLTYGVSTHSRPKAAGASLKSLAPSGFAAPSSLSSQEKREREYNTAFSVAPAFAIS